jgi:serine protease Do
LKQALAIIVILLCCSNASSGDDSTAVPKLVKKSLSAVVAVRWGKSNIVRKETFRQRWNRQKKEKYGSMNQKGDGTSGAGFFIDPDGHILTILGLVQKAKTIEVLLSSGDLLTAKIIAKDKRNHIALLKVPKRKRGYPFLKLCKTRAQISQTVFSLGNSFKSLETDLQVAISRGQVTSIYTVTKSKGRYKGTAIETTASTNPGNYGGPLLNSKGQVVGLLSSGYLLGRRAGLAIPADQIKKILPELLAGKAKKPYLGIEVKVRATDGLGVPILAVREGWPAARAGLKSDDVILSINGMETNDAAALKKAILTFPPYSELELRIKKADGKRRKLTVQTKAVALSGVRGM